MRTATSASATWRAPASASLNTATDRIPRARSVRITLTAISPRLATSTVLKVVTSSHPEYAVGDRLQRCLAHNAKRQPEHGPGVRGVDHTVIPQPRCREERVALILVLRADGRFERLLLVGRHLSPHGGQHRRGLFTAHHRGARVGPHQEEAGATRPAPQRIVARTVGPADHDRELRHPGARD